MSFYSFLSGQIYVVWEKVGGGRQKEIAIFVTSLYHTMWFYLQRPTWHFFCFSTRILNRRPLCAYVPGGRFQWLQAGTDSGFHWLKLTPTITWVILTTSDQPRDCFSLLTQVLPVQINLRLTAWSRTNQQQYLEFRFTASHIRPNFYPLLEDYQKDPYIS